MRIASICFGPPQSVCAQPMHPPADVLELIARTLVILTLHIIVARASARFSCQLRIAHFPSASSWPWRTRRSSKSPVDVRNPDKNAIGEAVFNAGGRGLSTPAAAVDRAHDRLGRPMPLVPLHLDPSGSCSWIFWSTGSAHRRLPSLLTPEPQHLPDLMAERSKQPGRGLAGLLGANICNMARILTPIHERKNCR